MRTLIAIAALLAAFQATFASASEGAWLIYDLRYKEYFLLRIDMKTSRTGEATIAGSNQYAGKRVVKKQQIGAGHNDLVENPHAYNVDTLSGRLTIRTSEMRPFMIASYNSAGDEISGEFFNRDGESAGRFVGARKGESYHRMDLYQICRPSVAPFVDDSALCVNRGQNQECYKIGYPGKNTFLDRENCLEELPKAEQAF